METRTLLNNKHLTMRQNTFQHWQKCLFHDLFTRAKHENKKLKQIREQKERYRKNVKKKAINFLNKKNAADLLKEHREKQKTNKKVN